MSTSQYAAICKERGIKLAEVGELWEHLGNKCKCLILQVHSYPSLHSNGRYEVMMLDTGRIATIMSEISERYAMSGWRLVA